MIKLKSQDNHKYPMHLIFKDSLIIFLFGLLLGSLSGMGKPMHWDEGIWSYIGQMWSDYGILPYTGTIENKTPGIFYLFALSYAFFDEAIRLPRLTGIILTSVSAMIIYFMANRLYDRKTGFFSGLVFVLIMPTHAVGGDSPAQTETFMVFFTVLSFLAIVKCGHIRNLNYYGKTFCSGFLVALAVAFKQVAVFDLAAVLVFTSYLNQHEKQQNVKDFTVVIAGAMVGTFCSILPLLINGLSINHYILGAWTILLNSGSSNSSLLNRFEKFTEAFLDARFILFYISLIWYISNRRKSLKSDPLVNFWLIWLGLDFIAVSASGYYFEHQLKQIVPALSIITGLFVNQSYQAVKNKCRLSNVKNYGFSIGLFFLIIFSPFIIFERRYWGFDRYEFSRQAQEVGLCVRENTEKDDYVLYWGSRNQVMSFSQRRCPSRYFNNLFCVNPEVEKEIKNSILEKTPRMIIIDDQTDLKPPSWLIELIHEQYDCLIQLHNCELYKSVSK